jgi:hypothetical protein
MFNNLEPMLQLLGNRKVIQKGDTRHTFPKIPVRVCCERDDHAPIRHEEGFEEATRASLREFRINYKIFLLARNMKMKVLDPSPVLRLEDYNGDRVWGTDPVHPLVNDYRHLVDLYESELARLTTNGRKRAGSHQQQNQNKRQKTKEKGPDWEMHSSSTAVRRDVHPGGQHRGRSWWTRPRL